MHTVIDLPWYCSWVASRTARIKIDRNRVTTIVKTTAWRANEFRPRATISSSSSFVTWILSGITIAVHSARNWRSLGQSCQRKFCIGDLRVTTGTNWNEIFTLHFYFSEEKLAEMKLIIIRLITLEMLVCKPLGKIFLSSGQT